MKKSLFSMSMAAALLACTSVTAWAAHLTIIPFNAGDTAVATDVNANFNAVAGGVDTNATAITDETTRATAAEGANATAITDETTRATAAEGANATAITDETTRATAAEGANATAIAANTTAIGNIGNCPSGMVPVGPLCVDTYEASVYDAPTGGNPIAASTCAADGSDCAASAANPIYAQSVFGVAPSATITRYQAAQACANVGKRLPTTAEWLMAANGTPAVVPVDRASGCNVAGIAGGNNLGTTGESMGAVGACVSSTGVFDMLGGVWEWSADFAVIPNSLPGGTFNQDNMDTADAIILGSAYNLGIVNTHSVSVSDSSGPLASATSIGFRCVQ
ncbi:MAG: hypothetical protein BMS9Abin08_1049 [Gammaproteobacteria bacterium]|nr:MAG: hypothetical protein BMS9Abin08_1049 [Gammaproteobacteria bacterium]